MRYRNIGDMHFTVPEKWEADDMDDEVVAQRDRQVQDEIGARDRQGMANTAFDDD